MKHIVRLIAVAALLLVVAACHAPAADRATQASEPMELKIYAVPPEQTMSLTGSLGNALGKTANITSPAPGKLLVYAPRDAQSSIADAIASLGKSAASEPAAAQIDLHFWIVDAQAGPGSDDVALKPLAAALDSVRKSMGPLHFQLDQAAAARTSVGPAGSIKTATNGGYPRSFHFKVSATHGNTVQLSLGYGDHGATGLDELDTQLGVMSGKYVVLAQAPGACAVALPGKVAPPCPQKPMLRLLIVRADILPPQA